MSLLVSFLLALLPLSAPQNEKTDSLVRLMSAQSAQLYQDEEGRNFHQYIALYIAPPQVLVQPSSYHQ